MDTPQTYMKQLISYLSSDKDVAMHVNRNFGTSVTPERVARLRQTMPVRRR